MSSKVHTIQILGKIRMNLICIYKQVELSKVPTTICINWKYNYGVKYLLETTNAIIP